MQEGKYKLTNQQNNIYLLDVMYKNSGINNIGSWLEIDEEIDVGVMQKVANIIAKKNDCYRLRFNLEDKEPYQYVEEYKEFDVEVMRVRSVEELEKRIKAVKFDLSKDLPFKFAVFKYPNGKGGFVAIVHHLAGDAWTMNLIILQIVNLYYNLKNNIEITEENHPSYIDYILSQQEFAKTGKIEKNQKYWEQVFDKSFDVLSFKNKSNIGIDSIRREYMLDKELLKCVRRFCEYNNISEYIFMLSVYSIYFGRIKNINRYVIGNPILNRSNAREKATSGLFMSTNPFLVEIDPNASFLSFAKKLQQDQMNMYRHLKYDYKQLVKYINENNNNYDNIYDVVFSYQNAKVDKEKNRYNTKSRWVENNKQVESLMIHLKDTDDTGDILFAYDYLTDVFTKQEIDLMHKRIEHIISQVLENRFIKYIDIVPEEEKQRLFCEYNDTYYEYNRNETIVSAFERICIEHYDKTALIFEDEKITYSQLNKKANQLARALKNIGIHAGDIVAVVDSRSIEMFISMLAILKIGAGYVPIDIEYPKDRIEYIIKNANCKVCITKRKYSEKFTTKGKKIFSDDEMIYTLLGENIFTYIPSSSIAYMIYTSGSTGNPKGVMITHNNVINFINGTTNEINFINKTIVSVTTISFDIFVLESWLALTRGCTVVIANEQEQNIPILLNKLCLNHNVSMIQTTPSRMKLLMSDNENTQFLTNMTDIMVGGESVPYSLLQDLKKITKARIYNMYGPTETTVWSTIKNLTKDDKITIGKPIANTGVYIFDDYMNLCPINVEGNIYIGGDGLAAGYYNNTDLTNEKFIHNPLVKSQYIYMTGDVGKWNIDGNLECLGRTDFQVKLHGHRIELGEIENTILKFEDIKEASVLCVNNEALYAYFTSKIEISIKELKKYLQEKLPAYMVPSKFMQIDNMPKTPNGKIDKKVLKNIKIEDRYSEKNQVFPKTEIEKNICENISQILNIECNNIEENIFALGMDSLNVIDLCNRAIKQYNINITVKDIFALQTIANISNKIESMIGQTNTNVIQIIPKANDKKMYKATTAQTRIYFASQMKSDSIVYNMPYAMILEGQFNIYNFKTAINEIIKRQVSLQISFEICDGVLYQKVNDISEFDIEIEKVKEHEIERKYREFVKSFDFSKAPLMRIKILQISKTKHVLLFDMHHIISDGMSLHILANEISQIYEGQEVEVSQLSFLDYSQYENQMIEEDRFNKEKEYWLNEFSNMPEPLNMPYDYKKDGMDMYSGKKIQYSLKGEVYEKIQLFAQDNDVTPNIVLLSIYYILLARYSQSSDVVVGMPIANRDNVNLQNSIGMYVNELPVRMFVDEECIFVEFLKIVKDKLINVFDNSNYPNGQILQLLRKNNINVKNTLFDTMFIFQNKGMPTLNLSNIKTMPYVLDSNISKYNFSMEILDQNDRYDINIEYVTELFENTTMINFLNHYINILNEVLTNEKIKIEKIQMLGEEEKSKLIHGFNNTKYNFNPNETIHKMISDRANVAKNDIALVFENEKLTYIELEQKTNSLAKILKDKGAKANDVIAIMVPRSLEMLVGIMGVLKSGASYMPVDISYPKERIEYMLENSNAKFVLVADDSIVENDKYINISLKENDIYENKNVKVENINSGEDVAYLIYTSGSTGKPKGVMVKHKGITNLVHYSNNNIEFLKDNAKRRIVSVTTMSFDIFVFETLIALQKGLTVVIANEDEQRIPSKLNALIEKNSVDIIQTTPSRMQMLIDYKEDIPGLKKLKYVVLAGEQYKQKLFEDLKKINPNVISYNGYGPSETTIFSTLTLVNKQEKINIGKPIYNTKMYVLDSKRRIVPTNHIGELYIGGDGVSKGYINNDELTKERFVQNPYMPKETIYQTGDLVRVVENGEFECLGRTDSQVKIRGLRIELEEIEQVILATKMVDKVVVVDKIDNENRQYLSAYFTASEKIDIQNLRKNISKVLPAYMVPTHIKQIEEFKYTPNGKIDKIELRKCIDKIEDRVDVKVDAKTDMQKKLLKLFKEILGRNDIGITDNFFDMGGDSILAMRLQITLLKENIEVTYGDIFNFPTVELLEQKICTDRKNEKKEEKISMPINKYDSILNYVTLEEKIKKNKVKGVILTGATGYVGMHILASLLDNKVGTVYCLVRPKENKSGFERLKEKLHFYFSTKYDKYINKKIIVIETDVTKINLNFTKEMYKKVSKTNVVFINALANVSHYGEESEFYTANVESVRNIAKFCMECNKKLFHISTISVSGNALADQTYMSNDIQGEVKFKESNLYIKQPLNNIYIKTKFMAERIMLDNIMQGLDGYILRVGNVMGRYVDGHFQQNVKENAYVNRLKAIYNLGAIPEYIKGGYLEFTPVDCLANSIIKIVFNNNDKNRVFHLFNNKHITITKFISICEKLYKKIDILSEEEFNKKLYEMLKSDNYSISFILNDLNKDKKLQYESNIKIDAEFTNRYLRKIGFEWPEIEEEYIKNFFDYLFSIDFFRKE